MAKTENGRAKAIVLIGVAVNFILFLVKLYTGLSSSSITIYSDAINNLFDVFSCLLALLAVILSARPATKAFPDGLYKIDELAGFTQSLIIIFTGAYLTYLAVERLLYPWPINFQMKYAVLLALTIPCKLALFALFRWEDKKRSSVVFRAIYLDSLADCGVTAMSLISFLLADYSSLRPDGVFGTICGIIIAANGVRLFISSAKILLGKNDEGKITEICNAFEGVCGKNELKVRLYGSSVNTCAAVTADFDVDAQELEEIERLTGVKIYIRASKNENPPAIRENEAKVSGDTSDITAEKP